MLNYADLYRPLQFPAPHGRGPDGWPLTDCLVCGKPIPWWRNRYGRSALVSPKSYYVKKTCRAACKARLHLMPGACGPKNRGPIEFDRDGHIGLPRPGDTLAIPRPMMAMIQQCPQCDNRALLEIGIGKLCPLCGTVMYARDGDWEHELVAHPQGKGDGDRASNFRRGKGGQTIGG